MNMLLLTTRVFYQTNSEKRRNWSSKQVFGYFGRLTSGFDTAQATFETHGAILYIGESQ